MLRKTLYVYFICFTVIVACNTAQKTASTGKDNTLSKEIVADSSNQHQAKVSKTNGTVSHRYSATGCSAVVITDKITPHGDTLILIPIQGLEGFDKDGLKISFDYRRVMTKNPSGCYHGITALLYNVTSR